MAHSAAATLTYVSKLIKTFGPQGFCTNYSLRLQYTQFLLPVLEVLTDHPHYISPAPSLHFIYILANGNNTQPALPVICLLVYCVFPTTQGPEREGTVCIWSITECLVPSTA